MTMNDEKFYIGVDVSKSILDVYDLHQKLYSQFDNDPKGIKKLIKYLSSIPSVFIVMEATGGYEKSLANALAKADFNAAIVNPRQIRDFAKASGRLAKTDRIDAYVIALFGQKMQPKPNIMFDEIQQQLAALQARRQQLVDMIIMEKNRLYLASKISRQSIERHIKMLEKELKLVDMELAKLVKNDAHYNQKCTLLTSIKGIGLTVATNVIANLPELGQLSAKQISALVGVAPLNCDSGKQKRKRFTWGGRAPVRSSIFMATLVAIKHNIQIKLFYERLCNSGKAKKVAVVACMHKLVIIMNAMLKYNQTWQFNSV